MQKVELNLKTAVDCDNQCNREKEYGKLARKIIEYKMFVVPKPLDTSSMEKKWSQGSGLMD